MLLKKCRSHDDHHHVPLHFSPFHTAAATSISLNPIKSSRAKETSHYLATRTPLLIGVSDCLTTQRLPVQGGRTRPAAEQQRAPGRHFHSNHDKLGAAVVGAHQTEKGSHLQEAPSTRWVSFGEWTWSAAAPRVRTLLLALLCPHWSVALEGGRCAACRRAATSSALLQASYK